MAQHPKEFEVANLRVHFDGCESIEALCAKLDSLSDLLSSLKGRYELTFEVAGGIVLVSAVDGHDADLDGALW